MKPILIDWSILKIYSYPLFMGIAWGVSYQLYTFLIELYQNKTKENLSNYKYVFWGTFLFSWIGAKVFFLLSSANGEYEVYLNSSSFWFGGGFVFYGGLVFGLLFILLYSLILKKFPKDFLFLAIPPLCFSHAIGRVGCLLAGCCYGVQTELPWAIELHGAHRHPVQLYETFILLFIGILLLRRILKRSKIINFNLKAISVSTIFLYFTLYSTARYLLELLRGDLVRGVSEGGFSTSQLVSIILFIFSVFYGLKNKNVIKKITVD